MSLPLACSGVYTEDMLSGERLATEVIDSRSSPLPPSILRRNCLSGLSGGILWYLGGLVPPLEEVGVTAGSHEAALDYEARTGEQLLDRPRFVGPKAEHPDAALLLNG